MAKSILIIGESGSGKSRSLINLDPKETVLINVANKALPFRGWVNKFSIENKNYKFTMDHSEIAVSITNISNKRPEIKTIIVDDFQYTLVDEFVERAKEIGFTKFNEMAKHIYDLTGPKFIAPLRSDLTIVFLAHNEIKDDGKSDMKTIGKILDGHIKVAGLFTVMLHTEIVFGSGTPSFYFRTITDGSKVCKSPEGMFPDKLIPNDLDYVLKCISAYDKGLDTPDLPSKE